MTNGSELIASRSATDLCMAMKYNLRMLGVNIDSPSIIYADNQNVAISSTAHTAPSSRSTIPEHTIELEKQLQLALLTLGLLEMKLIRIKSSQRPLQYSTSML